MLMLSRVAERAYWAARYLERAENVARLVSVYNHLLVDLPRGAQLSWEHLIRINGAGEQFEARYKNRDERNIVKFLLADDDNPGSMLSALGMVRENMRTTRDVIPPEAWEYVNELHMLATAEISQGINRSQRHEFLSRMIAGCQQINGLLDGTMSRGHGWDMLRLGRYLERADMTSRILEAGCALSQQTEDSDVLQRVIWVSVLNSLSADMSYRKRVRNRVNGNDVVRFALLDEHFPRSAAFCLEMLENALAELPFGEAPLQAVVELHEATLACCRKPDMLGSNQLLAQLNKLQIANAATHSAIYDNWFKVDAA